jgi:arylsulfatase A-like enzyme
LIRPNIVFILIDDLGWKDLGCYGSSFYETPNLDRMAAEGMRFSDAYASCPVCSPTRASVMSGKYPATVGVTNFIGPKPRENKLLSSSAAAEPQGTQLPELPFIDAAKGKLLDAPYTKYLPLTERSIATVLLEDGGYQTWHIGKWHLGGPDYYPEHHGFEVNIGGCDWGMPREGYFSPYGIETLANGVEGEYLTDRLTDEAIRLINEADDSRPFFLNLWHYAVHTPIQAPNRQLVEKYEAKAKALGLDKMEALREGEFFPCEHKKSQRVTRRLIQSDPEYAAMVEHLDSCIGRLLQALEDTGKADNTLIVFTSDNGGLSTAEGSPTSNAPLQEGKGWMYEGGVRAPLIVKGAGVTKPGLVCSVPMTTPDFYPTFLELAGLPMMPEQHVDGVSLVPLLQGAEELDREAIYWHYPHYGNQGGTPGCSIRVGDYKLIEFFEDSRLELYNLRLDQGEQHNLADSEPAETQRLHRLLLQWRDRIEASIPESNPDYISWHA